MNWQKILTYQRLKALAGSRSYEAGMTYFEAGAVSGLLVGEQTLTGWVQGSERYRVRLDYNLETNTDANAEEGEEQFSADCTCPFSREGNFCKHCVAIGVAVLKADKDSESSSQPVSIGSLRAYLEARSKEQLIALLLEQVSRDDELQNRLLLEIAQSSPNGPDLSIYRKSIDRAVKIHGYLDYGDVSDYADGIQAVIASLKELCKKGFATETRELTEYVLLALNEEINSIDDSNGEVGEGWQHLHQLHLEATLQSPGDPFVLADWLYKAEMGSDWDNEIDAEDYYPALGERGKERFREIVRTAWAALPSLGPGASGSYSGNRYRLTGLMCSFAQEDGDFQAEMEINQHDLSSAYRFLEIAQLYRSANDPASALEWAEKGVAQFSEKPDSRLLDFLVEQYTLGARYEDAYAILWNRFEAGPNFDNYRSLHNYAKPRNEWEAWRTRCWQRLREAVAQRKRPSQTGAYGFHGTADHSLLVTILLWEKRDEEAWLEAEMGDCSRELWLKLAQIREENHPQDALRLYREEIDRQLQAITNGEYKQPMTYLIKIRDLLLRTEEEDRFKTYISALRTEYKRKRNFIKILDENRFPV